MIEQTLRIEGIPLNLNEYRKTHFRKIAKQKIIWGDRVKAHIREQGIKPMNKIIQRYEFFFKTNTAHDPDNYACCAKFVNDALVSYGILPDDSFRHIKHLIISEGEKSPMPYMLVHMTEVEE